MINPLFKKTILISFFSHLVVFSIFSFSFGNRIIRLNYPMIAFRGAILSNSDLITQGLLNNLEIKKAVAKKSDISRLNKIEMTKEYPLRYNYYLKPELDLAFSREKMIFREESAPSSLTAKRKETSIIFHPVLPYDFLLYFKDRQTAHLELAFNVVPRDEANSIVIKRKISSGNLEVDLLSMRYIGHYLFIQQKGFPINTWQTVNIDFTPKNER